MGKKRKTLLHCKLFPHERVYRLMDYQGPGNVALIFYGVCGQCGEAALAYCKTDVWGQQLTEITQMTGEFKKLRADFLDDIKSGRAKEILNPYGKDDKKSTKGGMIVCEWAHQVSRPADEVIDYFNVFLVPKKVSDAAEKRLQAEREKRAQQYYLENCLKLKKYQAAS